MALNADIKLTVDKNFKKGLSAKECIDKLIRSGLVLNVDFKGEEVANRYAVLNRKVKCKKKNKLREIEDDKALDLHTDPLNEDNVDEKDYYNVVRAILLSNDLVDTEKIGMLKDILIQE